MSCFPWRPLRWVLGLKTGEPVAMLQPSHPENMDTTGRTR